MALEDNNCGGKEGSKGSQALGSLPPISSPASDVGNVQNSGDSVTMRVPVELQYLYAQVMQLANATLDPAQLERFEGEKQRLAQLYLLDRTRDAGTQTTEADFGKKS